MILSDLPRIESIEKRGVRHYKIDGTDELYPSVTTVTGAVLNKPALVPWAKGVSLNIMRAELLAINPTKIKSLMHWDKMLNEFVKKAKAEPDRIKDEAADIGTRIHGAVDAIIKGEPYEQTDDIKAGVDAYLAWRKSESIDILRSEVRVYSHRLKVAGCIDAIGRRKGLSILDWKSSKACYDDMAFQVGGYAICVEELTGESVHDAWIIRLPKTVEKGQQVKPEPHYISNSNLQLAKDGFAACKMLYDIRKQGLIG